MLVLLVALPFLSVVGVCSIPFVTVYFIVKLFVPARERVKGAPKLHPAFESVLNDN